MIDQINLDAEWKALDKNFHEFQLREIQTIQKSRFDDPSPWLERTRWLDILEGLERPSLLELIADPDTLLLRVLWGYFDLLVQASQQILKIIGFFGRFEIVRTEAKQSRAKPFRAYQNPDRIKEYSRPWKTILAFFVRTQEDPALKPRYNFNSTQQQAYDRLIDCFEDVQSWEDFRETASIFRQSFTLSKPPESDSEDTDHSKEEESSQPQTIPSQKQQDVYSLDKCQMYLLEF